MKAHAAAPAYSWRHWLAGCAHAAVFAALLAAFGCSLGNPAEPSEAAVVMAGAVLATLLAGSAFGAPLANGKGTAGVSALPLAESRCQGLALTGLLSSALALVSMPASSLYVSSSASQALATVAVASTLLLLLSPLCRSRISAAAAASHVQ